MLFSVGWFFSTCLPEVGCLGIRTEAPFVYLALYFFLSCAFVACFARSLWDCVSSFFFFLSLFVFGLWPAFSWAIHAFFVFVDVAARCPQIPGLAQEAAAKRVLSIPGET